MSQILKLINFKEGLKSTSGIKEIIYSLVFLATLFLLASALIYLFVRYVYPAIYKFVYRNYIVITEENYVVLDIRIYSKKDERLVVENEDMDRFLIWEPRHVLAVPGDVLTGYKKVNTKTGKVLYLYNKAKVFYKKEKGE